MASNPSTSRKGMTDEKLCRVCIKFYLTETDGKAYEFLKNIPQKHRPWEAKKLFIAGYNNTVPQETVITDKEAHGNPSGDRKDKVTDISQDF